MWEVGVGMAVESNGEKMGTTVIEQQLKKKNPQTGFKLPESPTLNVSNLFMYKAF